MAQDNKQPPTNSMGDVIDNKGIVTQGQIGNNTINVGPSQLTFQTSIADDLARKLPEGKPIVIHSVGSLGSQSIADQYQAFLTGRGFKIKARSVFGTKSPPPDYPISIDDRGDTVYLTIDPSVVR